MRYDHVWSYAPWEWLSAGGVDLSARFREGHLVNVFSYYRSPINDEPEMLFRLDWDATQHEGEAFRDVYCPE